MHYTTYVQSSKYNGEKCGMMCPSWSGVPPYFIYITDNICTFNQSLLLQTRLNLLSLIRVQINKIPCELLYRNDLIIYTFYIQNNSRQFDISVFQIDDYKYNLRIKIEGDKQLYTDRTLLC